MTTGTEISIKGRTYTIQQELEVGPALKADLRARGFTGREFIVQGKRGATKLVAENTAGGFTIMYG